MAKAKGKKEKKEKHNPKIKIDNFTIRRSMGESSDWKKLDLTRREVEVLNEIGHTGKHKGRKTNLREFFESISKDGVKYEVTEMNSNNMEFTDTLLITRVTLK